MVDPSLGLRRELMKVNERDAWERAGWREKAPGKFTRPASPPRVPRRRSGWLRTLFT